MAFEGQITSSETMTSTVAIGEFLFASQDESETDPNQCEFSGANKPIIGITAGLTDGVLQPVGIATGGWTFLTVNGNSTNIAKGDPLESAGSGIGIKAETDKHNVGAYAREAATTDGAIIKVSIAPLRQVGV